jgi:deoxyinosine 3'endonuclease (endonuclease V)
VNVRIVLSQDKMAAEGLTELALADAAGETVAVAVLRDAAHRQPVFVSAGHRVALPTAVGLVRRCCLYKVSVYGQGSEVTLLCLRLCIPSCTELSAMMVCAARATTSSLPCIRAAAWQVGASCGRTASTQHYMCAGMQRHVAVGVLQVPEPVRVADIAARQEAERLQAAERQLK